MYIIKEDKLKTSQHEIIELQSDDGKKGKGDGNLSEIKI